MEFIFTFFPKYTNLLARPLETIRRAAIKLVSLSVLGSTIFSAISIF